MTDKTAETGETFAFQAEVSRLLKLMVHSVYSETEVFLRELISNASDACDKLRYEAVTAPDLLGDDPKLRIRLAADKEAGTLTVADNGIGMSRDDLVAHLGTIAQSGTKAFVDRLAAEGAEATDAGSALIGQFGVGFYSAFMVADEVTVTSRRAGSDESWTWRSDGSGEFTVTPAEGSLADRGTEITLHLRDDSKEFAELHKLREIVRRYSDHVSFPVELALPDAEGPETLNTAGALWTRPKSDITDEQYTEFYHHTAHAFDAPWHTVHYRAEGRHEYTVLLFLPSERPFDLFDPAREGRLRLYVKRVYITDKADLLPGYLRFVRGIVDSEDMPLNISREMLQNNPIVRSIRSALTKRVISEIGKAAEKDAEGYAAFWEKFGPVLKEGVYEDAERREDLLKLSRFRSTAGKGWRSLADYVADMKPNQTAIYYLTGDDQAALEASPLIEGFRARGLEVLLLTDPVDDFWTMATEGFDGKPLKPVSAAAEDLAAFEAEGEEKPSPTEEGDLAVLIALVKQALGDTVADVRRSSRLTDSPVCLVADDGGMNPRLQQILAARGGGEVEIPKVLELNGSHELIVALSTRAAKGGASEELEDAARLLLDEARILEGEPVSDPAGFARRLGELMRRAFEA